VLTQAQIKAAHHPPCQGRYVTINLFGAGRVTVRAYAADAVMALDACLRHHKYRTRREDTGAGVCRKKVSGVGWSIHAFWIALDLNWQCLSGDTEVLTWDGVQRLADLAGTTQRILTRDPENGGAAKWIDAEFNAFGDQEVYEVRLSRRGIERTVRATADHTWWHVHGHEQVRKLWRNRETTTADLSPGDRILGCLPPGAGNTLVSSIGVAAGNVFGDGSRDRNRGSRVDLFGPSVELLRFYPEPNIATITTPNGVPGIIVSNLPGYFKDPPSLDESASYLLGWLAGYFAADGSVSVSGQPSICSAKREHLELFRLIALRVGIGCGEVRTVKSEGYGGVSEKHSLNLLPSTVPERFFVRFDHRERFVARAERRNPSDHLWRVESVTPAGSEPVYCPHVPDTGVFALDGFILTGNSNPYGKRLVTDMPAALPRDVCRIRTMNGRQVWNWGGYWSGNKDAMHYEIVCTPADLATGIDPRTVPGYRDAPLPKPLPPVNPAPKPAPPKDNDMALYRTPQNMGGNGEVYAVTDTHFSLLNPHNVKRRLSEQNPPKITDVHVLAVVHMMASRQDASTVYLRTPKSMGGNGNIYVFTPETWREIGPAEWADRVSEGATYTDVHALTVVHRMKSRRPAQR